MHRQTDNIPSPWAPVGPKNNPSFPTRSNLLQNITLIPQPKIVVPHTYYLSIFTLKQNCIIQLGKTESIKGYRGGINI